MRFRQVDTTEKQSQLLARKLDRGARRYRPGQRPGLEAFGAHPSTGVVPEQDLDPVLPLVGEDEQVTRKRIEAERLADDARQRVEGFPQVGGLGREVHPGVGEEAQHRGNWAKSSPTQPNSGPSGTRSFHPLGATISGQSQDMGKRAVNPMVPNLF